ncbi:UDP-2,3-diacylglucosamine diphosphatase [Salipiger marinus]|jgi:UDP-2,3-diacylglucosamine pyrophosphatase LpxH|uniref:UDP-2,3-diacylglucosamine pyrophosphatase LpxH n=1 Tax=Salipiger marinus TaxID=555512 RepID=A0A1G8IXX4_9RHOB|nr:MULTISPECIES: UDP-2,3-diacylglucosamine diphosphatase [Salipiger]MCD1618360.1 UDP-2,3-diacylglucosamine diphosphatase [Salipiger manganoxidans]MEB3418043.1 UDP-2,3-diacylglucosamine diphosphatase [Salipiger manganoxidans]SDI23781.1 UDP-2,3-diacylglucosamine pyrophosphatase LpxH [Salipiger marinus]HBM59597.1 UDP-2,3-diacylglucosamine diphosphatase [Citreicella sp.]
MPSRSVGRNAPKSYRSLFISDLHLGARACRVGPVQEFLRGVEAETIYLVGDIFDLWHGGRLHWTPRHDAVLGDLRARAARGTRVVYLPGNHDAAMRTPGARVEGWEICEAALHRAADGRSYLVLHGDQCDPRFLRWHLMTRLGSRIDASMRQVDGWMRRRAGLTDWERSFIDRIYAWSYNMLAMGDGFETKLTKLAEAAGATGVICGHSHKPGVRTHGQMTYANCGDWVDSLTALVEDFDGRLQLLAYERVPVPASRPSSGTSAEGGALAGGAAT